MLGISDIRKQLFTSRPELERATNSSYHDMTREIVLPRHELESVLSCVYTDIPAELTLSEKASIKAYSQIRINIHMLRTNRFFSIIQLQSMISRI